MKKPLCKHCWNLARQKTLEDVKMIIDDKLKELNDMLKLLPEKKNCRDVNIAVYSGVKYQIKILEQLKSKLSEVK